MPKRYSGLAATCVGVALVAKRDQLEVKPDDRRRTDESSCKLQCVGCPQRVNAQESVATLPRTISLGLDLQCHSVGQLS